MDPVNMPGGWIVDRDKGLTDGHWVQTRHRSKDGWVHVDGATIRGALPSAQVGKSRQARGATDADLEAAFVAAFPGKIGKLLVEAGAHVAAGDSLLVVEAMKMEFAIKAPVAGTVRAWLVNVGQAVHPGTRFVDFEKDKTNG